MESLRIALIGFVIFTFHRASAQYDDTNNYIFPRTEGEYKYIASVSSKAGQCTGTIISERWILTAAHCLYSKGKVIGEKDAKIKAGIINYASVDSEKKHETMSKRIMTHPRFWANRIAKYDVALVLLRDPIVFDKYKGNISIAADGWPQTDKEEEQCMVAGFGGYRSSTPLTKDLKVWNVTAGHGEEACPCARRFQYKRLICVKEINYPQICKGDDGAPLVCGNVVRGIAHMIWDTIKCDDPTYPLEKCTGGPTKGLSTFTFLCPLNDWILSVTQNENVPPTPRSCKASCISCHSFVVYLFVILFIMLFFNL